MILSIQRQVHDAISEAIRRKLGVAEVPLFAIETPPTRALGDLAVPVAFQLARALRKAPKAIAQELAEAVGAIPGVTRIVAAPNGYLNLYLDRQAFFIPRVRQQIAPEQVAAEKTIVEHTAINPNKAAHIGHLRNAALGDTLVRALRFRGTPVETQNYIDDTGVQVADVIVGFREIEHRSLDEIRTIADTTRFDYYCWDLYSKVTEWYDGDKARLAIRAAVLHDLEHGGTDTGRDDRGDRSERRRGEPGEGGRDDGKRKPRRGNARLAHRFAGTGQVSGEEPPQHQELHGDGDQPGCCHQRGEAQKGQPGGAEGDPLRGSRLADSHPHAKQLEDLADLINPIVRGWMQYYGAFYRTALYPLLRRINAYLIRWIRKKFKRLRTFQKAHACWRRITRPSPRAFAHWAWVPTFW